MARYSSNFGNKLQMMVGIGKEYGFTSNFDMPRPFTLPKMELPRKMANSQSDCRTASRVEVKQLTHSGDKIEEWGKSTTAELNEENLKLLMNNARLNLIS